MGQEDTAVSVLDEQPGAIPVLPLRDVVVYPHMVIPLFVGREKSIKALDVAMADNKQILLVAQNSFGEFTYVFCRSLISRDMLQPGQRYFILETGSLSQIQHLDLASR